VTNFRAGTLPADFFNRKETPMKKRLRHHIAVTGLAAVLLTGLAVIGGSVPANAAFNDEYVFAATRGVNDMEEVHPAFRVTLFPITVVLDLASLPFAVIAGFVS
jgi:hypothetical protein